MLPRCGDGFYAERRLESFPPFLTQQNPNPTTLPGIDPTGLTLQVPLFIEVGEVLKIDTREGGEYLGRA